MRSCLHARIIPQGAAIAGRHIRTLTSANGTEVGMVVTPDARCMVVPYLNEPKLRVYCIKANDALTPLHTFGGKGAGSKVPSLIASNAEARTSPAQTFDNVSLLLLYSVVATVLRVGLAGITW